MTEGQSKTYRISPNAGFHIDTVLVDGEEVGTPSSVSVSRTRGWSRHSCHFCIRIVLTLYIESTAATDGNGAISPVAAKLTLKRDGIKAFTMTRNGLSYRRCSGGRKLLGAPGRIRIYKNYRGPHTISASFAAKTCLRLPPRPAATAASRPVTVPSPYGSGQYFTITAAGGYEVADVVVDGQSQGAVDHLWLRRHHRQSHHSGVVQSRVAVVAPEPR